MHYPAYGRGKLSLMGLALGVFMLPGLVVAQQAPSVATPALTSGMFRLTVTERAITLEAYEASVQEIFAEIGRQTGIEMLLYPGPDKTVTTHFEQVPFREAFKRLAPNIVIVEAHEPRIPPHQIAKVYVLQEGQPRHAPTVRGTRTPQPQTPPAPFQFTFDPLQPGP